MSGIFFYKKSSGVKVINISDEGEREAVFSEKKEVQYADDSKNMCILLWQTKIAMSRNREKNFAV